MNEFALNIETVAYFCDGKLSLTEPAVNWRDMWRIHPLVNRSEAQAAINATAEQLAHRAVRAETLLATLQHDIGLCHARIEELKAGLREASEVVARSERYWDEHIRIDNLLGEL